jgi:hypothetical protein
MTLTVRELIELLSQRPPNALVVVGDPSDGGIGTLRAHDVRDVRLRFGESNGLGWVELVEGAEFDALGVWIA